MGNSSSTTNIENRNNTNIMNSNYFELMKKNIQSITTNVDSLVNQQCNASLTLNNLLNVKNSTIKGSFNVGAMSESEQQCKVLLEQKGVASFRCVNTAEIQNEIGSKMVDQLMTDLTNNVSAEVLQTLQTEAETSAKSGLGGIGNAKAKGNVSNINNYKQTTENKKVIQDVIKNIVENNLNDTTINECTSQVEQNLGFDLDGAHIGEDFNLCNYTSNQVGSLFTGCLNQKKFSNSVANDVIKALGIKVEDSSESAVKQDSSAIAKTLSSTGISPMMSMASSGSSCFLIIIILAVVVFFYLKKGDTAVNLIKGD